MDAIELRIGNILICQGKPDRVIGIEMSEGGNAICCMEEHGNGEDDLEPIPLTAEWLILLGFSNGTSVLNRYINEVFIHDKTGMTSTVYADGDEFEAMFKTVEGTIFTSLPFVHTLQNLFFAVCSEDLLPLQNKVPELINVK